VPIVIILRATAAPVGDSSRHTWCHAGCNNGVSTVRFCQYDATCVRAVSGPMPSSPKALLPQLAGSVRKTSQSGSTARRALPSRRPSPEFDGKTLAPGARGLLCVLRKDGINFIEQRLLLRVGRNETRIEVRASSATPAASSRPRICAAMWYSRVKVVLNIGGSPDRPRRR